MKWEVVIGLETHCQLTTESKIFSGASTRFGAEPNTQASPVDLALPGVLPVMNRKAVERAIQFGLAIDATVAPVSIFARKNYFYPDLPKGYQISQFALPVVLGGSITFPVEKKDGTTVMKTVNLTRAHLEEDAGKSVHEYEGMSGIDLNRAGTPLLEIVTEPEMRSPAEAIGYAKALHSLVTWLGISDGNMQEGSFRFMEEAMNYEIQRQIELIEDGGKVKQQTRGYDPDKKVTFKMRDKEDSDEYRYFPDPDLPPLVISPEWIARVKDALPELPSAMRQRLVDELGLPPYDASVLTQSKAMATYFEDLVKEVGKEQAKQAANWLMGDVSSTLNREACDMADIPVSAGQLALVLKRINDGTISNKIAKDLFRAMWEEKSSDPAIADQLIEKNDWKSNTDTGALEAIVDEVLAANAKSVEEYRAGKEKAFNAIIGQAMKATKGKANPAQLTELLKKKLG